MECEDTRRIVVLKDTGDHFLGLSHWDSSVELSFGKDGSVSIFGYSLRPTDTGELCRKMVFSRARVRNGKTLASAIEQAIEEVGIGGHWAGADAADTVKAVQARSPALAPGLRIAWADLLGE